MEGAHGAPFLIYRKNLNLSFYMLTLERRKSHDININAGHPELVEGSGGTFLSRLKNVLNAFPKCRRGKRLHYVRINS